MEGENLPGLAISRSFGDLIGHEVGITHEPEVSYKELDMDDKYMVIGSDGVWDVMNSAEVVGYIFQKSETYKDKSADFLVEECRTRWEVINLYKQKIHSDKEKKEEGKASKNQPQTTIDDITSVIYFFNFDNN
jgi:integrin-linked kinase-associated serine/threonine phosphatase 2C